MKVVKIRNFNPYVNLTINFDVYVRTSEVKVLLLFKAGTTFNESDVARCKKYAESNCLYINEEDYFLLIKKDGDDLKASMDANGVIDHKVGLKITKFFFESENDLSNTDKLGSMVNMASNFVVSFLKSSKDQRSQALAEILKDIASDQDIFVQHASQVAAFSTMIALMTENITLDIIVELNLVSILHGMGLMLMSNQQNELFAEYADLANFKQSIGKTDEQIIKKVIAKHFDGHNKLTTSDSVIFLQHLSIIEQNIEKIRIKNVKAQSILKTISDLKMILSTTELTPQNTNPYITAKILAVADRLVSLIHFYKKNPSFIASAIKNLEEINDTPKPIFDKAIVASVSMMA